MLAEEPRPGSYLDAKEVPCIPEILVVWAFLLVTSLIAVRIFAAALECVIAELVRKMLLDIFDNCFLKTRWNPRKSARILRPRNARDGELKRWLVERAALP